jgi:hypothetical protein
MTGAVRAVLPIVVALAATSAAAQTPPPRLPFASGSWKPLSTAKPATGLKMGALDVRFEKTTLNAISNKAGTGKIFHQGDAGESIYWLCYTVHVQPLVERLWLVSYGGMGGPEHAVTSITGQQLQPTAQPTDDCPALPSTLQPLSLGRNVWLGATDTAALKILGRSSYQKGQWWSFDYQGKVQGNCQPNGFDLINWLFFETAQGRIVLISAGQVTSC